MPSSFLSQNELDAVNRCIEQVAGGRKVHAACLYGSKAAGYARPDSDIDIVVVLEGYPYVVKYVYAKERVVEGAGGEEVGEEKGKEGERKKDVEISALVVDRNALERDAQGAFLGEFVAGRLLHIYEPLVNPQFLRDVEQKYKRRVIVEEAQGIVDSAGVLGTEITFPLEFVHFSKIKRRAALYPNAAYSYYRTYASCYSSPTADAAAAKSNNGDNPVPSSLGRRNLDFALDGYRRALGDIMLQDPELFVAKDGGSDGGRGDNDNNNAPLLQISGGRILAQGGGARLKLAKKLQRQLGSYLVHTYAGRKVMHLSVKEAESKIMRSIRQPPREVLAQMSRPRDLYLKLPEGELIAESGGSDWLGEYARRAGLDREGKGYYSVLKKRLGNVNSRTMLYTIGPASSAHSRTTEQPSHPAAGGRRAWTEEETVMLAVKEFARTKAVKWAALSLWTAPVKKRFRADPLFRLGCEYKAARHVRSLGLHTPAIEAVVIDRRLLVTRFVEGRSMADVIRDYLRRGSDGYLISMAGGRMGRVHAEGSSFGNIKPKNVIVAGGNFYFTDLEQFAFDSGDQAWDIAQFLSWGLKGVGSAKAAAGVVRQFLEGYASAAGSGRGSNSGGSNAISRLAKSRRHIESFYPVLSPRVAMEIKKEIRNFAG